MAVSTDRACLTSTHYLQRRGDLLVCAQCSVELALTCSLGGDLDAAAVDRNTAAAAVPSGTTSPAGVAAIGDRPGSAVRAGHLPFVGGELRAAGSQPGEDAHAVPATDDRFAS